MFHLGSFTPILRRRYYSLANEAMNKCGRCLVAVVMYRNISLCRIWILWTPQDFGFGWDGRQCIIKMWIVLRLTRFMSASVVIINRNKLVAKLNSYTQLRSCAVNVNQSFQSFWVLSSEAVPVALLFTIHLDQIYLLIYCLIWI